MNKKVTKAIIAAAVGGAAAAAAAVAATGAYTKKEIKKEFKRGEYSDRRFSPFNTYERDLAEEFPRVNVQFMSGENTLQGYIYGLDIAEPKGLLVFAHGITVGHETYINQLIWFVKRGWRVFAYDATGSCTSEGEGTVGLVQSALDLDCALTYAESDERLSGLPVYLLGHSWGGYAVCAVQNFDHKITAAVSMSGYADPLEMLEFGSEGKVGKAGVKLLHPFIKGYNDSTFGENADLNAVEGINKSGVPTLVIHGENDRFVDFDRVSIYSKQADVTNIRAEFLKVTGKYATHSDYFKSDRSNEYAAEYMKELAALAAQYSDGGADGISDTEKKAGVHVAGASAIPDDVRAEFAAKWDRELINELNTELYETIENFYLNNTDNL